MLQLVLVYKLLDLKKYFVTSFIGCSLPNLMIDNIIISTRKTLNIKLNNLIVSTTIAILYTIVVLYRFRLKRV